MVVRRSEYFVYQNQKTLILNVELDDANRCKRITSVEFSDRGVETRITRTPSGEVTSRIVDVFEGTRLLSSTTFDGKGQMGREKTFEYEGNRLFKSDSKYYGPDGHLFELCISSYNSEGRIAKTFGLKADGKPLGDGRYKYEYDTEGRKSKVWSCEWGDIASSARVYEYTCDERGNWIERRTFDRFRSESSWRKKVTTRKLTYYGSPELIEWNAALTCQANVYSRYGELSDVCHSR
jgi:hypothetical protein